MKRDQWGRPRPFPRYVRGTIIAAAIIGSIPIVVAMHYTGAFVSVVGRRVWPW